MAQNSPIQPSPAIMAKIAALDIRPTEGVVMGAKGRLIGSVGSWRGGRCRINLRVDGRIVSIPRYYLIWWKYHGVWPKEELDHRDEDKTNDAIDNLQEAGGGLNAQLWKPSQLPKYVHYDRFSKSYRVKKGDEDRGRYPTVEQATLAASKLA